MKYIASLTDEALLENTLACARDEREKTAILVAHLAEVYRRDLALKRGYPSLFKYAREALGLSDKMAWERTTAAQLSIQIPETIDRLASGELSLDAACELWRTLKETAKAPEAPPIVKAEKQELLTQVLNKTRKESEHVLQTWAAERRGEAVAPKPRTYTAGVEELTEAEYAEWNRLRDLLSHKVGSRDPKAAFNWLVQVGLDKVDPVRVEARAEKRKTSKVTAVRRPKEETVRRSKNIAPQQSRKPLPAALKRRIWIRDDGKCQHTDPQTGRKCETTAFLDYDHIVALADGGTDQESNLRLSCASHNRRRYFWD